MKKQLILVSVLIVLLTCFIVDITYDGSTSTPIAENNHAVNKENIIIYTEEEIDKNKEIYKTETGEKYHLKDCRYLRKSKFATTLSEAKAAGLGPCSVCKPPK